MSAPVVESVPKHEEAAAAPEHSWTRVAALPLVHDALAKVASLYDSLKGTHEQVNNVLVSIEGYASSGYTYVATSKIVKDNIEPKIPAVDAFLIKHLDTLETNYPIVKVHACTVRVLCVCVCACVDLDILGGRRWDDSLASVIARVWRCTRVRWYIDSAVKCVFLLIPCPALIAQILQVTPICARSHGRTHASTRGSITHTYFTLTRVFAHSPARTTRGKQYIARSRSPRPWTLQARRAALLLILYIPLAALPTRAYSRK